MSILGRWHKQVAARHEADREIEYKHNILSTEPKSVSPDDIERLEEQMVPWLRKKRRMARRKRS